MKLSRFFSKKYLGIDIGSYNIKVVELSSRGGRLQLENYGEISSRGLFHESFRSFRKDTLSLSTKEIAKAIQAIFEEANITTKKAFFSLPDYTTFFSTFLLPPMSKEEISFAVETEARRHIPLPLGEVTWSWEILEEIPSGKEYKFKILLVAVPQEVTNQYQKIAHLLGLESFSLEAEIFSLMRALIEKKEGKIALIDIGAKSTTCSIVENGILKLSRSFDLSGDDFTERIVKSFGLDEFTAEKLKKIYGLLEKKGKKEIQKVLLPLAETMLYEVNQTFLYFSQQEGKEIEKIILSGGGANLPGLLQYFQNFFKKEVEIADPFKKIYFPPILKPVLKELGPSFSVAVGLAKRGFE